MVKIELDLLHNKSTCCTIVNKHCISTANQQARKKIPAEVRPAHVDI